MGADLDRDPGPPHTPERPRHPSFGSRHWCFGQGRRDNARIRGQTQQKPATAGAGRAGKGGPTLQIDPVSALAFVGLEGLDRVASLLHRAGHEPADRVLLPAHFVHNLCQRGAVLALPPGFFIKNRGSFRYWSGKQLPSR